MTDRGHWIAGAVKNKGALHEKLHIPADKTISAKKLDKAAKKGGKIAKEANLAKTLKTFNRGRG